MLAKEQGITVVGAALAFELVAVSATPPAGWLGILAPSRRPRPMWVKRTRLRLVFLSMLGLALLMLRVLVMGGERPKFNRQELPHKFHPDRWVRMLSLHHLVGFNAGLLLAPMTLCHDWAYGSIPLVERWQDPRLLPTVGVYGLALLLLVGTAKAPMRPKGLSCSGLLLLGAALTAVPFLPSANLFFDVGFVVAERVLYLPSMGFVWLLVAALGWLKRRAGRPACSAVVMLLLALYSSKTLRRNREWTSNYSIHQAGYRDNPNNVKLVGNWGSLRWSDCVKHRALPGNDRRACVAEAEPYLRQALQMDPTHLPPALLLGKLLRYAGRQREATAVLEAALQHDDNTAIPSQIGLELGQLYEGAGQSQRAEDAYVAALNRHERFYEGYIALARFLAKGKRWTDCQRMYRAALALRPKSAETYHELGLAQNEWGRTADAIQSFALAAQLDPRHPHAAKNRDVLLAHMREKRG